MSYATASLTDAEARGWGKGWPTPRWSDMGIARGGGVKVNMHKALVQLVSYLLDATVLLGYPLRQSVTGSYAYRPMKTSSGGLTAIPSNHSWGLAIDINWDKNGFSKTLITDLPDAVVALWESHGFNWGGRWAKSKDAMHFEFNGTPEDAARYTVNFGATGVVKVPFKHNPFTIPDVVDWCSFTDMQYGMQVALVTKQGNVYVFPNENCWKGAPAGQSYWTDRADRVATSIEANGRGGYDIISDLNERYSYPL